MRSEWYLAFTHGTSGDLHKGIEAFKALEELLPRQEKELGERHPDTLMTMNMLGVGYQLAGYYTKSKPLMRKTYALCQEILDEDDPVTLFARADLAFAMATTFEYEAGLPLCLESFEKTVRKFGRAAPHSIIAMVLLGESYLVTKDLNRATALLEEAVALQRQQPTMYGHTHSHPPTFFLIRALMAGGDRAKASETLEAWRVELVAVESP